MPLFGDIRYGYPPHIAIYPISFQNSTNIFFKGGKPMAFVKLNETDRERILEYISKEPEYNLFVYGDVENYGVGNDICDVFVNDVPEASSQWDSLLLRYRDAYTAYSRNERFDVAAMADFLRRRPDVEMVSGKGTVVEQLASCFPQGRYRQTFLSCCTDLNYQASFEQLAAEGYTIRPLVPADADAMLKILVQIDEFAATYQGKDFDTECQALADDLDGNGMGVGAFWGEILVSCARTSGQNSLGSMILGVATLEEHRRHGLAGACVAELCRLNFEAGRRLLCLFYDNPEAGKIYRKLGFVESGFWGMLRF